MRSEPINLLREVRATHNVVVAVRDAEAARGAIEALERNGIDGSRIALLGSRDPELPPSPMRWAVGRVGRLFLVGVVLGAIAGAAIGWLTGVGGSAAAMLWAVFGGLAGGFVVAISSFGMSRAWWQTFEAEEAGTLAVGVHTQDSVEADLAERILASVRPLSLNRF